MYNMTFGQLQRTCTVNKYIITQIGDYEYGVNCAVQIQRFKRFPVDKRKKSNVIGYRPASFHEYISKKLPFGEKMQPFKA